MSPRDQEDARAFKAVLEDQPFIEAYCRRRGSWDSEGIAAETISIAWRKRASLDLKHCRPWLIVTARNLLMEEYRSRTRVRSTDPAALVELDDRAEPDFEVVSPDPGIVRALDSLTPSDREAVLLIAWEELTPTQAARSMGIRPATFRVRLHRARRRLRFAIENPVPEAPESSKLPIKEIT